MRLPGKHEMAEMAISDDEKRRIVRAEIQRIQEICNDQGLDLDLRIADRSVGSDEIPADRWPSLVKKDAERLVGVANRHGVVLTISQSPLHPLAMGHYNTVVEVRPTNPNRRKENGHADTVGV